jgi:hypothetical protein
MAADGKRRRGAKKKVGFRAPFRWLGVKKEGDLLAKRDF